MNRYFHPTLSNECNYLSMLVLKLIHVSERDPRNKNPTDILTYMHSAASVKRPPFCTLHIQIHFCQQNYLHSKFTQTGLYRFHLSKITIYLICFDYSLALNSAQVMIGANADQDR